MSVNLLLQKRDAAGADASGHRAGAADADLRGPHRGPHHGRRPPAPVRTVRTHRRGLAARRAPGSTKGRCKLEIAVIKDLNVRQSKL